MRFRILLMALPVMATGSQAQTRLSGRSFLHRYVVGCLGVDDDAFAVVRMPGGLPLAKRPMAGFSGTNDWISGAGGLYSIAAVKPRANDAFGISLDHLKVGTYRSSLASVSYGMSLSEEWQAGIRIGFSHTRIEGYGSELSLPFSVGAVYRMSRGLRFTLHVDHAGRPLSGRGPADARLPLAVHFGTGLRLSDQAGIALHLVKQEGRPVSFIPMLQYRPAHAIDVRAGLSAETSGMYLCLGLLRKGWRLDLSMNRNGSLGWSSGLAIQRTHTNDRAP
jgi:hypothetical protein